MLVEHRCSHHLCAPSVGVQQQGSKLHTMHLASCKAKAKQSAERVTADDSMPYSYALKPNQPRYLLPPLAPLASPGVQPVRSLCAAGQATQQSCLACHRQCCQLAKQATYMQVDMMVKDLVSQPACLAVCASCCSLLHAGLPVHALPPPPTWPPSASQEGRTQSAHLSPCSYIIATATQQQSDGVSTSTTRVLVSYQHVQAMASP